MNGIHIEQRKGSTRSGESPNGKRWSVTMPADYGEFVCTVGADGDPIDVYRGRSPGSDRVWVVRTALHGVDDEDKVFVSFPSESAVRRAFDACYGGSPVTISAIACLTAKQFEDWLRRFGDSGRMFRPEHMDGEIDKGSPRMAGMPEALQWK